MEKSHSSPALESGKSSSLISRRRKTVTLLAPVTEPTKFTSSLRSPVSCFTKGGKSSLQLLEVMSPLVGVPSRAIMKKVRKMKARPPSSGDDTSKTEEKSTQYPISLDEHAGFVRLVYHKARLTRTERDVPYMSLLGVARDILHAVRICMHVKRFIGMAQMGMKRVDMAKEVSKISRGIGIVAEPCTPYRAELDDDWKCLMADLTPMTPLTPWGSKQVYTCPTKQVNGKANVTLMADAQDEVERRMADVKEEEGEEDDDIETNAESGTSTTEMKVDDDSP